MTALLFDITMHCLCNALFLFTSRSYLINSYGSILYALRLLLFQSIICSYLYLLDSVLLYYDMYVGMTLKFSVTMLATYT